MIPLLHGPLNQSSPQDVIKVISVLSDLMKRVLNPPHQLQDSPPTSLDGSQLSYLIVDNLAEDSRQAEAEGRRQGPRALCCLALIENRDGAQPTEHAHGRVQGRRSGRGRTRSPRRGAGGLAPGASARPSPSETVAEISRSLRSRG